MLRTVVVGPAHPERGGVVAHTAELVHRMRAAGRPADLLTWERTYPRVLHPAGSRPVVDEPDVPPVPDARAVLRWDRPWAWARAVRHAVRGADMLVVVHVMAVQAPALRALVAAARAARPGLRVVVVAHNVLPHERHPGDRALVAALLRSADTVVVHTEPHQVAARSLGAREVVTVPLPPHLPAAERMPRSPSTHLPRLLFFGQVRTYKGVDLLLEALGDVPGPRLTVAGELWGSAGRAVRSRLAHDHALRSRVLVHDEYVPAPALGRLMASHDVLVLPYRAGSGSQNADLAFAYGLPVVASRLPAFDAAVRHGVDGLLVPPGDRAALVGALRDLSTPGRVAALAAGVVPPDVDGRWETYLLALGRGSPRAGGRPDRRVA